MTEAQRKELNLPTCYFNKDGSVKKIYARRLGNYVTDTAIMGFNGDMEDGEFEHRTEGFRLMLEDLIKNNHAIHRQ